MTSYSIYGQIPAVLYEDEPARNEYVKMAVHLKMAEDGIITTGTPVIKFSQDVFDFMHYPRRPYLTLWQRFLIWLHIDPEPEWIQAPWHFMATIKIAEGHHGQSQA